MKALGELPDSWTTGQVDDVVVSVVYGYTAKARPTSQGPRFLRITDIQDGRVDWNSVPGCEISDDKFEGYRLKPGDLVFARTGATTGKSFLFKHVPHDSVFASYLIRLRAAAGMLPAFMAFFFQTGSYWRQISIQAAGIAQPGVNAKKLRQVELPVAPLPEQHRIVEAIESYLTRLDDAVASLERVQKNLKRYRASVLKAAVEGRLVPTEADLARKEGREYEPANVLLERILKERRRRWEEGELAKMKAKGKVPKNDKWKQKYKEPLAPDTSDLPDLPEGWCWASLSQTCVLERGRFSIRPRNDPRYYGGQFPFVQIGDLPREGGRIRAYGSTLNEKGLSVSREFPPGTVLIAIVGATIANTGVLAFAACCPDSLVAAQPIEDLNGDYLDYFLRQNKMLLRGLGYASGGQPNINLGVLNPFPMPLPPREEQRRIGVEVGRHLSIIDHAEDLAAGNTQKAGRLRQSILKWAFEGKLVDQDPTDEPASVFLERIKAERAALETQKKANKKKTSRRKK